MNFRDFIPMAEAEMQRHLDQFRRDLDRAMTGGFAASGAMRMGGALALDVTETEDAVEIVADLPGVAEDDIDIDLNGAVLEIRAKRERAEPAEGVTQRLAERPFGAVLRAVTLPEGLDPEGVTASLKHGVLTVRAAKRAESKGRRIKVGG